VDNADVDETFWSIERDPTLDVRALYGSARGDRANRAVAARCHLGEGGGCVMTRFEVPAGGACRFTVYHVDPPMSALRLAAAFRSRRKAFNWTVANPENDIEAWRESGAKPRSRPLGCC